MKTRALSKMYNKLRFLLPGPNLPQIRLQNKFELHARAIKFLHLQRRQEQTYRGYVSNDSHDELSSRHLRTLIERRTQEDSEPWSNGIRRAPSEALQMLRNQLRGVILYSDPGLWIKRVPDRCQTTESGPMAQHPRNGDHIWQFLGDRRKPLQPRNVEIDLLLL